MWQKDSLIDIWHSGSSSTHFFFFLSIIPQNKLNIIQFLTEKSTKLSQSIWWCKLTNDREREKSILVIQHSLWKIRIHLLGDVIGSFYTPFCYNDSELNAMTFKSGKIRGKHWRRWQSKRNLKKGLPKKDYNPNPSGTVWTLHNCLLALQQMEATVDFHMKEHLHSSGMSLEFLQRWGHGSKQDKHVFHHLKSLAHILIIGLNLNQFRLA